MEIAQEDMPKIILLITVVMIVFAVGVYMFMTVLTPVEVEKSMTQTFGVSDPTTNQLCRLSYTPQSGSVTVEQYNGIGWQTVSSTYVSTSNNWVTVDSAGLDG